MNELVLFAGAGGGILGGVLLGWRTVCAVEIDPYARRVLLARQNDGTLPTFPVFDDVCAFDGIEWRGKIDVVTGGFPCQDISAAGKGAGITGERSGLWREMARIIDEVRPSYAFVENSPMLVKRGLAVVLGDLAEIGYDAFWTVMGADDVGAPHHRKRIWILAHAECDIIRFNEAKQKWRNKIAGSNSDVADTDGAGCEGADAREGRSAGATEGLSAKCDWWEVEPDVGRVVDGLAARVDRLHCIGNGQVPRVAAEAFQYLKELTHGEANG